MIIDKNHENPMVIIRDGSKGLYVYPDNDLHDKPNKLESMKWTAPIDKSKSDNIYLILTFDVTYLILLRVTSMLRFSNSNKNKFQKLCL